MTSDISPSFCQNKCPYCNEKWKEYIVPVRMDGLIAWISSTFVSNYIHDRTPSNLVESIKKFENVGKFIYNRPRTNSCVDTKFVQSTILQLISSGIFELDININNPEFLHHD